MRGLLGVVAVLLTSCGNSDTAVGPAPSAALPFDLGEAGLDGDCDGGDVPLPVAALTGDGLADSADLESFVQDIRTLARSELPEYRRFLRKASHRTVRAFRGVSFDTVRASLARQGVSLAPRSPYWSDRFECAVARGVWIAGGLRHDCVLDIRTWHPDPPGPDRCTAEISLRAAPDRALTEIVSSAPYGDDPLLHEALRRAGLDDTTVVFRYLRDVDVTYGPCGNWRGPRHSSFGFAVRLRLEVAVDEEIAGASAVFWATSGLDPPMSSDRATVRVPVGFVPADTIGEVQGRFMNQWRNGDPETIARNKAKYGWRD